MSLLLINNISSVNKKYMSIYELRNNNNIIISILITILLINLY